MVIGGTSLQEWSPDFELGSAGASPGIEPEYLHRHGVANPFQAMISRAEAGLASAPEGSVIRGLLWYQGENDAMVSGLPGFRPCRGCVYAQPLVRPCVCATGCGRRGKLCLPLLCMGIRVASRAGP
jgi:hypothetical protein